LYCTLPQECLGNIYMLQSQIFHDELTQNVISCIRSHATIKMVVKQEMHCPEIRELHTINLLLFIIISHQLYQLFCAQQTAQPWPF